MQILADENIPGLRNFFGNLGSIRMMRGADMRTSDLEGVDVLLTRSATHIDESPLGDNRPLFIGSATAGTDHVDTSLLDEYAIPFANAPGSNAESVVEYVLSCLSFLSTPHERRLRKMRIGIVGAGQVGRRLSSRLGAYGCNVVINDPPLQNSGALPVPGSSGFVAYDELIETSDIVTLHVPLTREGEYPTFHMFDVEQVERLKPGAWLINASRGPVVNTGAAHVAVDRGHHVVLDVWEGEPSPDIELVKSVAIATPHIAGYSIDGKLRGTRMIRDACLQVLEKGGVSLESGSGERPANLATITGEQRTLRIENGDRSPLDWSFLKQLYAVDVDHKAFVADYLSAAPGHRADVFASHRKNYPLRREFATWKVEGVAADSNMAAELTAVLDVTI